MIVKGTQHRKSVKIIALTFICSFLFLLASSLFCDPANILDDLMVLALITMYEIEIMIKQAKFTRRTATVNHFCGSSCVTRYLNTQTPELP